MTKKKVVEKKKGIKVAKSKGTIITDYTFHNQIKWDGEALETLDTTVEALLINARALNKIASLFTGEQLHIGPMLVIGTEAETKE